MATIIIITPPPKKNPSGNVSTSLQVDVQETPEMSIADILREGADILDNEDD